MAHIDNLIAAVRDDRLRAELELEYGRLSKTRTFGLVFDRHQPETVTLPRLAVRTGEKVQVLGPDGVDVDGSGVWTVSSVDRNSQTATIVKSDGDQRESPTSYLVATREFGDPIFPGLKSTGRILRGSGAEPDDGGKPTHVLINAENHHALEALTYPYERQVDAIYIDPPFNSGAPDWKYNNKYVDSNDPYRHSKWLSFMDRRLRLAKRLLNPSDSVLICAIDENEVHRLALVISQIFPTSKVQMVSVLINPAGASIIDQFTRIDEHLLFVHVGAARPERTTISTTPGSSTIVDESGEAKKFVWEPLQRRGGNSLREDTKSKFFPIYIDETREQIAGCGEHLPLGFDRSRARPCPQGVIEQWPIKQNGVEACWQLSAPTLRRYLNEGRVKLGRKNKTTGRWGMSFLTSGHMKAIECGELEIIGTDPNGALIVQNSTSKKRTQEGRTLWTSPAYSATTHGSILLNSIIPGRKFPYPKSLYAVEDALRYYLQGKPDALVLDFFAGSGTTTHAVARLNKQDGGRRRTVLVTNNEVSPKEATQLRQQGYKPGDSRWEARGIAEFITKPRLISALTGRDPDGRSIPGEYKFNDEFPIADGLAENIEFFELTYEDSALISLGRRFEAIAPLLWLKAGALGTRIEQIDPSGWALPPDATYGILFEPLKWTGFVEAIERGSRRDFPLSHIFIVTDSTVEFQQIAGRVPGHIEIKQLYADYLRTFEINTTAGGDTLDSS